MVRAGLWVGLESQPLPHTAIEEAVEHGFDERHSSDDREETDPHIPHALGRLGPGEPLVGHLVWQQAEEAEKQDEAHQRLRS